MEILRLDLLIYYASRFTLGPINMSRLTEELLILVKKDFAEISFAYPKLFFLS